MNSIIVIILFLFWFLRTARAAFFNIWLWQIKEYRIDRMRAHLEIFSGMKLILNPLNFFKLAIFISLPFLFFSPFLLFRLVIALFILESLFGLKEILSKKFYYPKFTFKAIIIFALAFGIEFFIIGFFIYNNYNLIETFPALLFILSVILPVIIFLLVLIFKPVTNFFKARIIKKAKEKIKKFPNLIVIGITGSYGKTSAKEFLATILSEKFHPVKSAKSGAKQFNRVNNANVLKTVKANTNIGVAKTVLNELNSNHKIFVVEMGAYKRGEIKAICDIVKPKIGILTGINEQHMALFGSLENTVKAKFELIEALPEDGLSVLNKDLEKFKVQSSKFKVAVQNFKFFSTEIPAYAGMTEKDDKKSDIYASDIKVEKDKIKFSAISGESSEDFEVNLIGKQNVSNILACAGVAEYLGMSLKEISNAVKKIQPIAKTMKNYSGIKNTVLIDDTYNSNPAGVMAALDYLEKSWLHSGDSPVEPFAKTFYNNKMAPQPFGTMEPSNNSGRKIILFPGIIELGSANKKVHHSLGKKMSEVCDLIIITKKDFADYIENHSVPPERNNQFITQENPEKVYQYLKNYLKPNDIVLFESRGMESVLEKLKEK